MKDEVYLFAWELRSMDDYSCSLPSATTIGKKWKNNRNAYRHRYPDAPEVSQYVTQLVGPLEPCWYTGEYIDDPDPKLVGIKWSCVVLVEGPEPPGWVAPDWANLERWDRENRAEAVI